MKVLRVNMATLAVTQTESSENYQLLGGRTLIARMLLDEVKPACEPLGRHNKLIYAPGLLSGSKVFSSGRISIGAKSPLTGGIKESNGGGIVAQKLGRLGYKAIVIEDIPQNSKRYLLHVSTAGARLLPADELWGLGVYDTARCLQELFGKQVAISCIGPAGENKLSAAGIANTDIDGVPNRYCGRGGLGAVMGSKGIKAIIFDDSSSKPLEPAEPEKFRELSKEFVRLANESQVIRNYTVYGTSALVQLTNALGGLPTRNFSNGIFEQADNISGEKMHEVIDSRKGKITHACMSGCMIRCSNSYVDLSGREIVSPLEYETIALMGSNLAIDDLDTIAELNRLCNDFGVDTIEIGAALGVAMAGGMLSFGDSEGALDLVREIGKGSLVGRVVGMGAKTAGKVLGVINVPVVKGQAMAAYDPRAIQGIGVTYATSAMGADHTAGSTIRAQVDHNRPEGQAEASKTSQYNIPIYDCLGLCMFASAVFATQPDLLFQTVNAQLGTNFTKEMLSQLAVDTVNWELEFNRKAGFTNVDDRLPEYFYEVPNPATNTVFGVCEEELDTIHTRQS